MANKETPAVAPAETQLPAALSEDFLKEVMQDAGAGTSQLGMDDVAVPYLYVLQALSPQANPDSEAYIEGAKAGMFYNNVTNEIFDGREVGLEVIPCAYERKLVEWVHRDDGGGYVQDHSVESNILSQCKPDANGKPRLPNGHMIVETAYHYVYMKNPHNNRWEEIIIPMKSSMLVKSRRWNKTLMSTFIPDTSAKAPRWLYPYRLKTIKQTKDTNTWSNLDIERLENPVSIEQYHAAKNFAEQFKQGAVVRGKETAFEEHSGQTIDGNSKEDLEEIPF